MDHHQLVFIKLGGSLITDKNSPMTSRPDIIQRLADEISQTVHLNPNLRLLIGHGSGSFGHAVAHQYQTQSGGRGKAYWTGFSEVWAAARELNQIVIDALTRAGLPVIAFPPSAGIITRNKHIQSWDIRPIKLALSHGLMPVVQGDVIFDESIGGTILSTEAIFQHLATSLLPQQILLVGLDKGVYWDIHQRDEIIPRITLENINDVLPALSTSEAVDVTGGMLAKVRPMMDLVQENPTLEVKILSGIEPGNLIQAFTPGDMLIGTLITHGEQPSSNSYPDQIKPPV